MDCDESRQGNDMGREEKMSGVQWLLALVGKSIALPVQVHD